ncbi:hypothetical protein FACS1894122_13840 [Alphaproteobacteria bacterium]|nr:hypothetical protein FACS1894122_13840 [Alphaproteobacteria bacterium]
MNKTPKTQSKKTMDASSKPAQLAKLVYDGIVRYIKAENARNGEKKKVFSLDSDRKRRVNVYGDN